MQAGSGTSSDGQQTGGQISTVHRGVAHALPHCVETRGYAKRVQQRVRCARLSM
jgi:hypothetical protein